uniref:Reverse transcriptase domain-containing protein n=1 Tax=Leptobrachium leishanense TaxID=445787 RepID=A0A8C5Q236_9ANUR
MFANKQLCIVSYNARGLNAPEKRSRLLRELYAHHTSIAFVQETHFRDRDGPTLRDKQFPVGYFGNYTKSKSRGVAILIARDVPFTQTGLITDPHGRFLFLKGTIAGTTYTFASVYISNTRQHKCIASILRQLDVFQERVLILAGDFNVSLDPRIDTSKGSSSIPPNILRHIKRSLHSYRLVDVWRAFHAGERDYSYFSGVHQSYSRLDLFFLPQHQLHMVTNTYIATQTWSDHAPVVMTLTSPLYRSREHTWHLNTSLLTDPMLRAEIDEALKQYFEINTTPEVSPHTIWEAHKATIRGLLIAKATAQKRDRKTKLTSLLDEIRTLETSHKTDQSALLYQQLLDSRKRLNGLLQADIRFMAVKSRAFFALQENKPGRLLARLLRKRQEQSYVSHVKLRANTLTTRPDEILQEFVRYYTDLYNGRDETQTPDLLPRIADYLRDNVARRLSKAQAASLEDPILQEELAATLKHIKNNKCPGPDGFSAEYYKTFAKTLSSPMLTIFNATREGSKFSHHTLAATITVIPKPDKDLTECKHFRPISLLNADVKNLARILADRLKKFLPLLIRADQVGFVPGREARDATTRVLNAIALPSGAGQGLLLLSMDAEKAFDRVGWPFLLQTLEAFSLHAHFLHWIRSLYDSPTARVRVNGALSASFPRQGCPLSPLLFALFLEPFLEAIRRDDRIQGIQGAKHTHKVSAYADDLLFLLPHPRTSMPHLLEHFKIFGELSGYKINNDKSNMLSLDMSTTDVSFARSHFPFQWCTSWLKYLGIWISHTQEGTYKHNYGQLLQDFRLNLSSWTHLPISWLGRVSVLKMNVMPRLLYTLQALPILLPRSFFKELDSIFLAFIWSKGRPRVKIHLLRRP